MPTLAPPDCLLLAVVIIDDIVVTGDTAHIDRHHRLLLFHRHPILPTCPSPPFTVNDSFILNPDNSYVLPLLCLNNIYVFDMNQITPSNLHE